MFKLEEVCLNQNVLKWGTSKLIGELSQRKMVFGIEIRTYRWPSAQCLLGGVVCLGRLGGVGA